MRTTANLVFVGSEHGDFFAVNAADGIPVWRRQAPIGPHRTLGYRTTGCTDLPDRRFGITSTPVLDKASNTVYVAAGDGKLDALDMSSGLTRPGWPVILASWSPIPRSQSGGGIWGWGGVSVERGTGRIFAATGNVFDSPTEHDFYAEHVVALSLNLKVLASNFAAQIDGDDDLSSHAHALPAPGVPAPDGGDAEARRALCLRSDFPVFGSGPDAADQRESGFIGGLAYDPTTDLVYVAHGDDPPRGSYRHGLVALNVGSSCKLSLAWQQPSPSNGGVTSAPSVADGVVYYANGAGNRLFAYDAANGTPLWNSGTTLKGPVFAAPTIVNGALYAGSWDHKLHAFSIP